MICAPFGISNRINAVVYCLAKGQECIFWPLNNHCRLEPKDIFSNELFKKIKFVNDAKHVVETWKVSSDSEIKKIEDAANFIYSSFLPDFIPPSHDFCVHIRNMGYRQQIQNDEFVIQANRFCSTEAFVLIDSQRESFYNKFTFKIINPSSRELEGDLKRSDIQDQLEFCKDLKTVWNSKACLSSHWQSTITDMRSLLGKSTFIALGNDFQRRTDNFAISCGKKKIWLG
jgi:hypothetical protein